MSNAREQLDHIKARAAEATPGPWGYFEDVRTDGSTVYRVGSDKTGEDVCAVSRHPLPAFSNPGNAEFIAHARTDSDQLTKALEAVLNELDRAESGDTSHPVKKAEREAARRIRAAIENALSEGEG